MAFWKRRKGTGAEPERDSRESEELSGTEEPLLPEKMPEGKDESGESGQSPAAEQESPRLPEEELAQEKVMPVGQAEQKQFIQDCCDAVAESDRQIARARLEYERVTEYLTDIQKIDRIEGESRGRMLELCKRIKHLLQERSRYKDREMTISNRQIRRFDRYQEELIDEIKKMYQNEMYQKAIESDMKHLEAEKAYIRSQQHEIMVKQNSLKGMAKGLCALIASLVVLFILLYFYLDANMTYPYIGTLLLAAVSATVIFAEANKNRRDIALSDRRMNKAVGLLNRTKIKYINNVSVLDYDREKYGVRNAGQFEELWGEYCKVKEYERKYRENTEQLSRCNAALQELLTEYQVADTEVWLVQTYAILDNREMVEIRHDLNQRRQKLREQIQYNTKMREEYLTRMNEMLGQNPALQEIIAGGIGGISKNA